jgi:hypothetical protein
MDRMLAPMNLRVASDIHRPLSRTSRPWSRCVLVFALGLSLTLREGITNYLLRPTKLIANRMVIGRRWRRRLYSTQNRSLLGLTMAHKMILPLVRFLSNCPLLLTTRLIQLHSKVFPESIEDLELGGIGHSENARDERVDRLARTAHLLRLRPAKQTSSRLTAGGNKAQGAVSQSRSYIKAEKENHRSCFSTQERGKALVEVALVIQALIILLLVQKLLLDS